MIFWVVLSALFILGVFVMLNNFKIIQGKRNFTTLESSLIDALLKNIKTETAELLKAQIDACPIKTRIYYPKSEDLHLHPKDIKILMPNPILFPRKGEYKLATISFKTKNSNEKWKVEFGTVNGHLFDIKIRPNPKKYQKQEAEVIRFKIEEDPFDAIDLSVEKTKFGNKPTFTGYLAEWDQKYVIEDIFQPISSDKSEKYFSRFKAKFPEEYLDLVKQTEGLRFKDCRVLGISEIYTVSLDDGNYLYLAENEGEGMLGIKEKSRTGELYYISFEDENKKSYGKSFKEAIERLINKG